MTHTHPAPVAVVTGAGSGIGRSIVHGLSKLGWRAVLAGRRPDALGETALGCDAPTVIVAADLAAADGPKRVIDAAAAAFGRIDALVNNAGIAPMRSIGEMSADEIRNLFAINALAPALTVNAAWGLFAAQHARDGRGAVVVNVTSLAAVDPFPGLGVYGAAKSAANALARAAAQDGAGIGLRAFAVAPGAVETGMLRALFSEQDFPRTLTLDPATVADVVIACIEGRHDARNGGVIDVPSPS